MRVLVTGGAGLLGRALLASAPAGVDLHATRHRAGLTADGVAVHDAPSIHSEHLQCWCSWWLTSIKALRAVL
jgi:dTDP-4-dehydrorhamnose reductase